MTEQTIPESHHDLIKSATVGLSTLSGDGTIQTTAIWVLLDEDGVLRTSLAKNRLKYRNLLARPTATIFSISTTDPMKTLEIRATATVEDDDPERSFMAKLIATYGMTLQTMPEQAAEDRVIVTFTPTRIRAQG